MDRNLILDFDHKINKVKNDLHGLIRTSNLKELKKYVDEMQMSLLDFDDPSLLMLAVEIFLDPEMILRDYYQLEIISFLLKCGLRFGLPGGKLIMYLYEYCQKKIIDDSNHVSEEYYERKLRELFDYLLVTENQTDLLVWKLDYIEKKKPSVFEKLTTYLKQHCAALKIQLWWKRKQQHQEWKLDL